MGDVRKELEQTATKPKIGIGAWISLATLIIIPSGALRTSRSALKVADSTGLCGSFGQIGDTGANFIGKDGMGTKDGFMAGLDLIPAIMFFCGIMGMFEQLGAFKALDVLLGPILKPMLNILGKCDVAFISSFTGSDVTAVMTKELADNGDLTDNERTTFVIYQYADSTYVNNTITGGAPLIAICPMALGPVIMIKSVCKLTGANLVCLILKVPQKKGA